MLFDVYLFADYSGATHRSAQRKAIRLACASRESAPAIFEGRLTREELVLEFVSRLTNASRLGQRVCFGQDHQYGIPFALAQEIGVANVEWREMLTTLCAGDYGEAAPPLGHPNQFALEFNRWLESRGDKAYFYSATKWDSYGVPRTNPRGGEDDLFRLTEQCQSKSGQGVPKPFNRIGDNGSVGGQTLCGLPQIRRLLEQCQGENVPVAVWPFDGLAINGPAYADAHVMVEPYPSAVRSSETSQSDESDALASAGALRNADLDGSLEEHLDLLDFSPDDAEKVKLEGWIVFLTPGSRHA